MLKASEFQSQEASNMVWNHTVLQICNDALFAVMTQQGVKQVECEPQHLANIAWGCAEISYG